jgi:hypothetical protein
MYIGCYFCICVYCFLLPGRNAILLKEEEPAHNIEGRQRREGRARGWEGWRVGGREGRRGAGEGGQIEGREREKREGKRLLLEGP